MEQTGQIEMKLDDLENFLFNQNINHNTKIYKNSTKYLKVYENYSYALNIHCHQQWTTKYEQNLLARYAISIKNL